MLLLLLLQLLLPKRKSNTKQKSTYVCSLLMLLPCCVDFCASPVQYLSKEYRRQTRQNDYDSLGFSSETF